jgi:1-acyl-sn-glycerol-3-phosphate acyltransferase
LGIQVTVEDRNRGGHAPPIVFAQLNQTSLLEILYWPLALPFPSRFIENIGFALIPFLGWASVGFGGIPIVRQWSWQTRRGLKKAERCLKKGQSLCISMEGRRSQDGNLSPYKKGPVVLALSTQAQIVPVIFQGARETLPHGAWRPRPGRVRVVFCEAIPTAGLTREDRNGLVARLHELAKAELTPAPPHS